MVDGRSDAELVAAYLGGERDALAGIYDRYADRLHDTASAMLHDPHEAADATQDVFLTATEKLGQLRDASRLKPWLFAILRHEVFRRSRRRQRVRPVDLSTAAEVIAPEDPAAEGATAAYEELGRSVRDAAAGLDTRDQLVLELTARQGLSGDELADALGVGLDHSHVLVHRMRDRVERSLGALAVARTGRRDCAELDRLLADWNGELTVLLRKRIARHIEGCDICSRTKQRYGAFALVAAAPALAAPPELRPRVLERTAVPRSGRRWPVVAATVAAATLLAVGAGVGLAVVTGGDEAAAPAPSLTVASSTAPAATVTTTPPPTSTAASPTTTAATTTTTTTATTTALTEPAAGRLELSDGVIDLGPTASAGDLVLANAGGSPISWTLAGDSVFEWSETAGQLEPGEAIELTASIDRANLPEGDVEGVTTIESDGGGAAVELRARVERAPTVVIVRAPRSVPCQTSVPPTVAATVDDDSDVDEVVLSWSGPGDSGETNMDTDGSGAWAGRLTIEPVAGTWDITVTATDVRGNVGSSSRTVAVTGC